MTAREFYDRMLELRELYKDDPEEFHTQADRLMLDCFKSIGYGDGVSVFEKTEKYYA